MKTIAGIIIAMGILLPIISQGADYYWVGGSGDFADLSHWATTSGGNAYYTVVPSADDNVYFDANSFVDSGMVVTISSNAVCRNMDWTGSNWPTLQGNWLKTLRIFGSLNLIADMFFKFDGRVYFDATTTGHTVNAPDKIFAGTVTFSGMGGEWTLLSGINVPYDSLCLVSGTLNTNGQTLQCMYFGSAYPGNRALILGNSLVSVKKYFIVNPFNLTFNSGTSVIRVEGYNGKLNCGDSLVFNKLIFANDTSTEMLVFGSSRIRSAVFLGGAKILGNNTFDTLVFSEGKSFVLESGSTQTIQDSLRIEGSCAGMISLSSSLEGSNCTIYKASGTVIGDYLMLKDVWCSGGALFVANNSLDLGNNAGWVISSPPTRNMYWVDNGGNWNDPAHWAVSSGGSGGACVPTQFDNVFFDQNSFSQPSQKVEISLGDVYCNNMNWAGVQYNPELFGTNNALSIRIFGSLTFSPDLIYSFLGNLNFQSASLGNTITTAGKTIQNNLTFSGTGGWELLDALSVNEFLFVDNGSFSTNNQDVYCKLLFAAVYSSTKPDLLDFTSSNIYIKNQLIFDFDPQNFKCGTSTVYITNSNNLFRPSFSGFSEFNRVIFTDTSNSNADFGAYGHFKSLTFLGNAGIYNWVDVDSLFLSPGRYYAINGVITINDTLGWNGTCNKRIYLSATENSYITGAEGSFSGNFLMLEGLKAQGPATFISNNTVDLGGNDGWVINSLAARNLYWVGNTGNWNDPAHWSLSSNGPTGECKPSPIDNVYFDQHSFTLPDQSVNITDYYSYCNSMSWEGAMYHPTFYTGINYTTLILKIYGSLNLIPDMELGNNWYFGFNFSSLDTNNTIHVPLAEKMLESFTFNGKTGRWNLLSDLKANVLFMNNGELRTNGHTLDIGAIDAKNWSNCTAKLVLDSSTMYCKYLYLGCLDLDCGTSTIYVNTSLYASNLNFNRVIFNSTYHQWEAGILDWVGNHYNSATFMTEFTINGPNSFDTLTFTPGAECIFKASTTQTVNHQLNLRGNNCFPVSLKSSQPGTLATISKPEGEVIGDYLELQDIEATGGAAFYAGSSSTNLGNNPGWTWGNAPGYVFGFPTDTAICQGDTLVLSTNNFNGGTAWLWQDGSTNPSFTVTETGIYSCRVTYAENCYIKDSIYVLVNPVPQMAASPPTQLICSGDNAIVNFQNINEVPGTTYYWTTTLQNGINTTGFGPGTGNNIAQSITNDGNELATVIYTIKPLSAGCIGDSVQVMVNIKPHGSSIDGKILYDNQESTPIACSKIYLKSFEGNTVDSSATDQEGYYRFCDVPNGNYRLVVDTTKPWAGVNIVDGLMICRHFTGLDTLQNLKLRAADTDNTHYINSIDAQLIAKRFVELIDKYAISDWIFEEPEIQLTEITDLTMNIYGICAGDVNGSNLPPGCEK